MKIKQTIIVIALSIGLSTVLLPTVVNAAQCGGIPTSIISCDQNQTASCPTDGSDPYGVNSKDPKKLNNGKCEDGTNPIITPQDTGVWGLLLLVINIMTAGIGILAVVGIVYGSILYTSAGDSAEKINKARDVIRNVIIGIVAYALMYAGLNFIIPGGLFTP